MQRSAPKSNSRLKLQKIAMQLAENGRFNRFDLTVYDIRAIWHVVFTITVALYDMTPLNPGMHPYSQISPKSKPAD